MGHKFYSTVKNTKVVPPWKIPTIQKHVLRSKGCLITRFYGGIMHAKDGTAHTKISCTFNPLSTHHHPQHRSWLEVPASHIPSFLPPVPTPLSLHISYLTHYQHIQNQHLKKISKTKHMAITSTSNMVPVLVNWLNELLHPSHVSIMRKEILVTMVMVTMVQLPKD